ncbi:MAG: beta-propeller domain-containing protein, partial [Ruminococcus sp.]|nr:beta-propeller domain-containing protein [Ruminococcus sp.]
DEYNGKLRVATTSRDSEQNEINNLYVLDENLRQLGSVTGFAQNESIKAVRYINDTAYVITYEQTDPLFVIDVSDPSQPAIKGEVKISGFSTLLVPVDDNTLLGIGYHTTDITEGDAAMEMQDGVKIVTFDVSDKSDPKVLDTQIFENYYSAVQHDPKALLVNFERGDFTIPMSKQEWTLDGWKNTSEALNFRVENGKIKIIDRYVSEKFSDQDSNLERCVHVGDNIYLLGTHYKEEYRYEDSVYNGYVEYRADIDSTPYK